MRNLFLLITFLIVSSEFYGQQGRILSEQDRAAVIDEMLNERMEKLLPELMEKTGIDCWVLVSREYNEDPALRTFLPATWLSARRRTILVFFNPGNGKPIEKTAIARYDVGDKIRAGWDMKQFPDQWDQLTDLLIKRDPKKIGINVSAAFAHADGIDQTDHALFIKKLPERLKARVVSAESLAVSWLETRTAREMSCYPQLISITHDIIDEGFSEKVITPGITTTDDVEWWFRDKFRQLGLDTWFHPTVDIQRNDSAAFEHLRSFSSRPREQVILPGDLLHVDIGITYLRLNTDVQEHAYILLPGETTPPQKLVEAFKRGNRVQDILTGQFKAGKSGNQILADALAQCRNEGLEAVIYTHPIGYHGHAAGPTIGMWDNQVNVSGSGDYPLNPHSAYSIELNCASLIPEWKKSIRIMLEEDGYFDGKDFRYINGRQEAIYVIPRPRQQLR